MKPVIMIVEDEDAIVMMLKYNLEKEGFATVSAENAEAALVVLENERPSLILLDWMLPRMSGVDMCREVRKRPELNGIPVIMLTARSEEADKLKGLAVGADDYITKPFSILELIARIKALLRRAAPIAENPALNFADIILDTKARKVSRAGRNINLGPTEFRLLAYLMKAPGKVFTRDRLLSDVWGGDIHVESRTVDVHIRRLRKALNGDNEVDYIRTVRAGGYSIDMDASPNE